MTNDANLHKIPEKVTFGANKAVWANLAKEISTRGAICELVDNAIDAQERYGFRDQINIDIEYDETTNTLRILDDGGGIPPKDLEAIFSLGDSVQSEDHYDSIGWAGIGLKRASVALGHKLTVYTRFELADAGSELTIDIDEWLHDEEKREYSVSKITDLEAHEDLSESKGTTVIEIKDLKFAWGREMGADDVSDDVEKPLDEYLADTYDLYISDDLPESRDVQVNISINGDPLTAESDLSLSWSPFDGLYPRCYPKLLLRPSTGDYEGDVMMDVRVGLKTKADSDESGVTLYANGRKILSNRTDEEAGFGVRGGLNQFNPATGDKRLVIRADMWSTESAEDLPFNTSKTGINPDDEMAREAYRKIKNATRAYFDAKTGKVPIPILKPYPQNSPYADNKGEWKVYNYRGRQRIDSDHKPGRSPSTSRNWEYPETAEFKNHVAIHAKLGIAHPAAFHESKQPAYLGVHTPPTEDRTIAETERLDLWTPPDDWDPEEKRSEWLYTDEYDCVDESFKGQLERHFEENYKSDQKQRLTLVDTGPEDEFEFDDVDDLETKVEEVIEDISEEAEAHARHEIRLAESAMTAWKWPTYVAALKSTYGIDIDDLTVVESREEVDQYLPGSDSSDSQDDREQARETAEEGSSRETEGDVSSDDVVSGTESESEVTSESAAISTAADSVPAAEADEKLDLYFTAGQEAQLRERYDDYDDLSHDDLVERILRDVMFAGEAERFGRQR
ncbi:ATP-binding protein [Natronosalvus rutilus]|uniref:ATP-binding protein n=1 Tax=Natronosalvus rutilus TaxID=2953753 RepID=A0A9E7SV89_9EURY|nr:ATP-binding protein [Natronosalvus rutilus]UTF52766.1 ATP-binding protein [Natronosalvus rutilus]